jgi:hypothetical protein
VASVVVVTGAAVVDVVDVDDDVELEVLVEVVTVVGAAVEVLVVVVLVLDVVLGVVVEVVVAPMDVVVVVGGARHAENSDVSFVVRSVAVAVSAVAPMVWPKSTTKATWPLPSVIPVVTAPRNVWPSPYADGSHAVFPKTSMR